jgi:hypothetical protein
MLLVVRELIVGAAFEMTILKQQPGESFMRYPFLSVALASSVAFFVAAPSIADAPGRHPAYLHAITDLRDARANLEHLSSDPVDHREEHAIENIDRALDEIKRAAIMDGKDIKDHMPVDAHLMRRDRFHKAMELLDKAKADVMGEEDQPDTRGLQMRVINHINAARHDVHEAIDAVLDRG